MDLQCYYTHLDLYLFYYINNILFQSSFSNVVLLAYVSSSLGLVILDRQYIITGFSDWYW